MQWAQKQKGFTIVELLIVVVVIAILAAITIVAYNGIQNRAKESSAKSSLSQAVKKIEAFKVGSGVDTIPATKLQAGLNADASLTYYPNVSGSAYCVSTTDGRRTYIATSFDKSIREGVCVDTTGLVVWYPLNNNAINEGSLGGGSMGVNGATTATGQNGAANGAYQFTSDTSLTQSIAQPFPVLTASAWVYLDNAGSTPGLIGGAGGPGPVHWEISSGSWRVRLGSVDRGGIVPRSELQTWSQVAFTYNRSTGAFEYYVNGNRVNSVTAGDSNQDVYFSAGLTLGQSNGPSRQWPGRIDDVRIYNRILSESDMKTLFSAGAQ